MLSKYWKTQGCLWGATTTVTGPNDARRVVWALGEFFFFFVFFIYLTIYICTTDALKVRRGPVGRQRQRQRAQTTRLVSFGPVIVEVSVYKGIRVLLYIKCTYIYQLILKKHEERKKKHSPKAQTTRLASFGPVTVVVAVDKRILVF